MHQPAQTTRYREQAEAATPPRSGDHERRLVSWLLVGSLATLAAPVLAAPIPPLLDYPNHLVRLWLIAGGAETPPLSHMYAVSWGSAYTNVGIDYMAAILGRLIPVDILGPVLVFLALLLPPLGAVAVNRAIFGGRHWWQVGFAFFACNATLLGGFLNFHIGIGLALLGAALEPRLRSWTPVPRVGIRLGIAIALLFMHLFALAFYCALLAGIAFGRELPPWSALGRHAGRAFVVASSAAIPALTFMVLAPHLPGAHVGSEGNAPLWDFSALGKAYVLLTPIATYVLWFDLVLTAAIVAPLVCASIIGRLEAHAGLLLAAGCLALLALAAPTAVAGTWWIDNRFPVMAMLALIAGTRPQLGLAATARMVLAGVLASVVIVRSGWIAHVWHERQADAKAVRRAVAMVPAGATVLPLENMLSEAEAHAIPIGRYFHNGHPTHWSLPVLAIMWRQAFVPNLFWAAGKQPLRVLSPWDQISFPEDGLLSWHALLERRTTPAHFVNWRTRYRYVLLLNADIGRNIDLAAFPELQLIADEGFARLYAIRSTANPLVLRDP